MLPPGLSMLWEEADPGEALRRRFGFDGFAEVSGWITEVVAGTWGRAVRDCPRLVISSENAIAFVRTSRGGLVVKWSVDADGFERLDYCTRLACRLAGSGLPVAAAIPSLDGRLRVVLDGPVSPLSVAVLPEMLGDWLDVGDEEAVLAAGASLARIHRALQAESVERVPVPTRSGLRGRIEDWLADADHGRHPAGSRRLESLMATAPELDDASQLLHGDFRAANVLTRASAVVAVLDFDDVQVGHRVDDLARASVYLGTRFRDWRPTRRPVRDAFRAGYESVRPLTPAERAWLEIATLWYGLGAIGMHGSPELWAAAL